MLTIKISAADQRIIERAQSLPELEGVRSMIMDHIAAAKLLQEMGRAVPVERPKAFSWGQAWDICEAILGKGSLTRPPFPTNSWYARISGYIKRAGMDEGYVTSLAKHAEEHLRKPISFDFLICQHERILAGGYDGQKDKPDGNPDRTAKRIRASVPKLPDE